MKTLKAFILSMVAIALVAAGTPAFAAIALSEDSTYKGEASSINVSAGGPTVTGNYGEKTFDFSRGSTTGINKIHQDSTTAALTVLELDQDDVDESFVDFLGTAATSGSNSIITDTSTDDAKYGAIKVKINGTVKYIRVFDGAS